MPVFPVLETEALVQEKDKTRLDGNKSYAVGGSAITQLEIQPSAADVFYDVTSQKYLDWQYTMTNPVTTPVEDFVATIRINGTETVTKTIQVISEAEDNLFSTDDQLKKHEYDILRYVPAGRATFKDVHRRVQVLMLDWLSKEGWVDDFAERITKERFKKLEEVQNWSAMYALQLIFEGLSNAIDDVFMDKSRRYARLASEFRDRSVLRIDTDRSGEVDLHEGLDIRTAIVVRR